MLTGRLTRTLLAGGLLLAAACGGHNVQSASPVAPANSQVATSLVIDQFLRAANSNDLDTMGRLWGTVDGPVKKWEKKEDVDKRLFSIASILRHSGYTIKGEEIVPGRRDQATKIIVAMKFNDQKQADVPFTLVWSKDKVWMIENIGMTEVMNRR